MNNFSKIHDEKCSFLLVSTTRIKHIIWNQHISVNVHIAQILIKNNYPEETELDTNPSLTLALTLTLSTVSVVLAISRPVVVTTPRLLILRIRIHQKIWGGIQSLDQESISDDKSQLHEIDALRTNMTEMGPAGKRYLTTYQYLLRMTC